jgi:hypothetical protein
MSCISKLAAALAAVPVDQSCTATAVAALYVSGHAAARQISPGLPDAMYNESYDQKLRPAALQQHLPRACMPVLAWLAAGLSSGLPPAASQQAHEMACVLLGVVALVVPPSLEAPQAPPTPAELIEAWRLLLQELGPSIGAGVHAYALVDAVLYQHCTAPPSLSCKVLCCTAPVAS